MNSPKMNRRKFICTTGQIAAGTALLPGALTMMTGCGPTEKDAELQLYKNFKNPPASARPFVRWWWNGNKITREEILRELDLLKAAGIGGVEINPIKFPNPSDPLNVPALEWLSPEWMDLVKVAVEGLHERGMIADIIVGSGWPFGGSFLELEEQTQIMTIGTQHLVGPSTIELTEAALLADVELTLHSKNDKIDKTITRLVLYPTLIDDVHSGKDVTALYQNGKIALKVPPGVYFLYYLVLQKGFQAVINGAPGADGPVLNHYSKSAVQKYLNRMSTQLKPVLGELGNNFRAMFCDSLELEGANWCEDMEAEFDKRRGYSLSPFLPLILFKTGHMGNVVEQRFSAKMTDPLLEQVKRVRYDFYITRMELFEERFVQPFLDWCKTNQVNARVQAYGQDYHPLEASMNIDIPECETWLWPKIGEPDAPDGKAHSMINKFVASGALFGGKKIVSCEEITNTAFVFFATLELIKIAGDQSNLSGVNHSILHGFNYSHPNTEFPGWVRYGTFFNERNPWWPYLRNWTDYKARLSSLLQNAEPQADIAILHPLADIWMNYGLQRYPFPTTTYPWYQFLLWEAIHQNGNGCDYISENILCQSQLGDGKLRFNHRAYRTLILMEVDTIGPDTAQALEKFAQAGGKIIFIKNAPTLSPEFINFEENNKIVTETMQRILQNHPETCNIVPPPVKELIFWFRQLQQKFNLKPAVEIPVPNPNVTQIHLKTKEKDIFFFTNSNKNAAERIQTKFDTPYKHPWQWNPETGDRTVFPYQEANNVLDIELEPAGSLLLVYDNEPAAAPNPPAQISNVLPFELSGSWQITLNHVNGMQESLQLDNLVDFKEVENLKTFAGEIIYQKQFDLTNSEAFQFVDLGKVCGISHVTLNDHPLGFKWYGTHRYAVNNLLKSGGNLLEIKVTTILGNYCKSLQTNPVAQEWTQWLEFQSVGLIGPVQLLRTQQVA
ncbi:hypothetical protein JW964_03385 [candidate division KSB1 bacterium]|nr:hypothetical protein [candidate division KSB1 bacterium]